MASPTRFDVTFVMTGVDPADVATKVVNILTMNTSVILVEVCDDDTRTISFTRMNVGAREASAVATRHGCSSYKMIPRRDIKTAEEPTLF